MNNSSQLYRGRFAPSPTGDLHFGSLLAALVSYCEARSRNGLWHLRIEDVDTTRIVPGADKGIMNTLHTYGMDWDGEVIYQTGQQQQQNYQKALLALKEMDLTYRCNCTRKKLSGHSVYPGYCRFSPADIHQPHSIRLICDGGDVTFTDTFQGQQKQNLQSQCGDFNVVRKDGLFSYQLAVVVDDAMAEINHIVRGIDILDSTARQIYLYQKLKLPVPQYAHFPIIVNQRGRKLSKQNHAKSVDKEDSTEVTKHALNLLNQAIPDKPMNQQQLIRWAVDHWQPSQFTGLQNIVYSDTP